MLKEPVTDPGSGRIVGYYRQVGVAAESHEGAIALLSQVVPDGDIDWEQSAFSTIEESHPSIARRFQPGVAPGVWYASGRAFFPEAA